MQRPPPCLQPQCCVWVIADEEPIIVTMSWILVGGGSPRCGMRDACTRGGFCHRRSATKPLSESQAWRWFKVQPGGGASRPGVCGEAAGVAVNGSKHRRDIRVSVTHARSPGWSAGQCTGGDILDNGGSAAQGLLAKKLPER